MSVYSCFYNQSCTRCTYPYNMHKFKYTYEKHKFRGPTLKWSFLMLFIQSSLSFRFLSCGPKFWSPQSLWFLQRMNKIEYMSPQLGSCSPHTHTHTHTHTNTHTYWFIILLLDTANSFLHFSLMASACI